MEPKTSVHSRVTREAHWRRFRGHRSQRFPDRSCTRPAQAPVVRAMRTFAVSLCDKSRVLGSLSLAVCLAPPAPVPREARTSRPAGTTHAVRPCVQGFDFVVTRSSLRAAHSAQSCMCAPGLSELLSNMGDIFLLAVASCFALRHVS